MARSKLTLHPPDSPLAAAVALLVSLFHTPMAHAQAAGASAAQQARREADASATARARAKESELLGQLADKTVALGKANDQVSQGCCPGQGQRPGKPRPTTR